jgi:hypothetical protein
MSNLKLLLFIIPLNVFLSCEVIASQALVHPSCKNIFNSTQTPQIPSANPLKITDLNSFAKAMTQGLVLRDNQDDLFEIYRKMFFGDPKVSLNNQTLSDVNEILKKHPELRKPHFRDYEISYHFQIYEVPEALSKFVLSQFKTAGQIRSNLFQIEANLGYWKKLLDFTSVFKNLPVESKRYSEDLFRKELNSYISYANEQILADQSYDIEGSGKKTKTLFKTLNAIEGLMKKNGRNTKVIRQAMVDLVHNVGYSNPVTQNLLKSKNGLEVIEGLIKILDERDSLAMELGYSGHFLELQKTLEVEFPSGFTKNEDLNDLIRNYEQLVLEKSSSTESSESLRVRSLSIQEAPFRSCLGGSDCSSRTYFSKALDPNFNYFTMTDSEYHSSGHVTVVLGTAQDPRNHKEVKVAFIDKVQNVPNRQLPIFLQAVAMSLSEKGYLLGIPAILGNHNGISNMEVTRTFIEEDILPQLKSSLLNFEPHPHNYEFKNSYSRAYDRLNLKIYNLNLQAENLKINPGQQYDPHLAQEDLNKKQFIKYFLDLKQSSDPNKVLKFCLSSQVVEGLAKSGFYTFKEYAADLQELALQNELPFQIRKTAFTEILLLHSKVDGISFPKVQFNQIEFKQLSEEIQQWQYSNDQRKNKFQTNLKDIKAQAFEKDDQNALELFYQLKLLEFNYRDSNGMTFLSQLIYLDTPRIFKWFITKPEANLYDKNILGFTNIDLARRLRRNKLLKIIIDHLPSSEFDSPAVSERELEQNRFYPEGKPSIGFVKIPASNFVIRKYENYRFSGKELIIVTKPFEFMSVHTTQQVWKEILEIYSDQSLNPGTKIDFKVKSLVPLYDKYINTGIKLNPSFNVGEDLPVTNVSYDQTQQWIEYLNNLSNSLNPSIQAKLKQIFPGHQSGDLYRLPTENEYLSVDSMLGLASVEYNHRSYNFGTDFNQAEEYFWYAGNSAFRTHPVGQKKPNLFFGKPIYDIHGNVSTRISDNKFREMGGSFIGDNFDLLVGFSSGIDPEAKFGNYGFRLVRIPKKWK